MSKCHCLYIIATPIGNLGDISYRALELLEQVDLIAAEDTRHSRRLLDHYHIDTPMLSLHEHNEHERIAALIERLESGQKIALISDAGTPLISDPGARLVAAVRQAGYRVSPVPGPCAAIAALSASGLPTERFLFIGFLPTKHQQRLQKLEDVVSSTATLVFYEAPHRIVQFLGELLSLDLGQRQIAIARELTKTYETFFLGSVEEANAWLLADDNQQKGEFVVMLQGAEAEKPDDAEQKRVLQLLMSEMPLKKAVKMTQEIVGGDRNALYDLGLQLK